MRPGDTVSLSYANGRLVALKYAPSPWVRFEADERGSRWAAERLEADREVRIEARQGEVRRSLWDAVEGGAVAPQVLLDFVQIFSSDFDFTADTRAGRPASACWSRSATRPTRSSTTAGSSSRST